MFNNALTWIVGIFIIILSIDCYYRFFRVKEGLDKPPKETPQQKQQEKIQEITARSQLTPAQINSNNLKYIQRSHKEIKKKLSDVKEEINNKVVKIKEQCCRINKKYYSDNCNTSTKRMSLPACQIKDPCKPCKPGSNDKDPHSCCPELIIQDKQK